ncbi:MAG: zinc ABC transporter substrate-binding protein [Planctomycetota bacterium]|nr:zinc ABC transporter substrate-binding protein [Planctomycetota bacterium]
MLRIATIVLFLSFFSALWNNSNAASPIRVTATTTVVADLVEQVGGDLVVVESLMADGVDPHSYRATPRDIDRLVRADLIVANGLHLEGKLAELLERIGRKRPFVAVGEAVPQDELLPIGNGLFDPHIWFDAKLWSYCPFAVADALIQLDSEAASHYQHRAEKYSQDLLELDENVRKKFNGIPRQRRVLITAHDAFRYFGRAYGLEVIGVQGTSTESEAGLADMNQLVDLVVRRRIPAVFVETSVSDRNVTALIEGASARGHIVHLGGRLYSDALGPAGGGGDTLERALLSNVDTIFGALRATSASQNVSQGISRDSNK